MLDREIDPADHYPLERCEGFIVDGKYYLCCRQCSQLYTITQLNAFPDPDELRIIQKTKCTFDGNIYKKGEIISPDGQCLECICDEKLKSQDLDLLTPQCQRKQCGLGVSGEEHDYLNRGCAPIYESTKTACCPIGWRCRKSNFRLNVSLMMINGKLFYCFFLFYWA